MNVPPPDTRRVFIAISPDEGHADITIADATRRVSGPTPKETRRLALDAATAHAAALGQDVVIEARDTGGDWRLLATAQGVVRALPAAPDHSPRRPARRTSWAAVAGATAVLLAAGALFLVVTPLGPAGPASGDGEEDDDLPSPRTLTERDPPPGFGSRADWALAIHRQTQPAVAHDGEALALVDDQGHLRVVDPEGATLWSRELDVDPSDLESPLRYVREGAQSWIAAQTAGDLWLWPAEGGPPERLELPGGAAVTYAGGAPLVTDSDLVLVPLGGRIVEVEAPEDGRPMVFDGDAVLFSLPGGEWQWRVPEAEERGVEPERPDGFDDDTEGQVLTSSADHVVVRWEPEDGDDPVAAVHDAQDGAVVGAGEVPPGAEEGTARWQSAEGWGAYDSLLVDFAEETAAKLPGFHPLGAADAVIYGELDDAPVAVEADAEVQELADDVARPWGVLDGRAIVVAGGEVYALPPE